MPESIGLGKDKGLDPLGFLKQVETGLKELKAVMDTARSLGLKVNIPGLNIQGKEPEPDSQGVSAPPQNPGQQVALFIYLLQKKYGDVTVNELLEKLKAEHGNKRLSQLNRGF